MKSLIVILFAMSVVYLHAEDNKSTLSKYNHILSASDQVLNNMSTPEVETPRTVSVLQHAKDLLVRGDEALHNLKQRGSHVTLVAYSKAGVDPETGVYAVRSVEPGGSPRSAVAMLGQ